MLPAAWLGRQRVDGPACLLHAHHEAIVHSGAVLLGALAQVVVQHLHIAPKLAVDILVR